MKKWTLAILLILALTFAFAATHYIHPVWVAVMKLEWREPTLIPRFEKELRGK